MSDVPEQLAERLHNAEKELRAHMGSWEYAFAMGDRCAIPDDPVLRETRGRADRLRQEYRDAKAVVQEHGGDPPAVLRQWRERHLD